MTLRALTLYYIGIVTGGSITGTVDLDSVFYSGLSPAVLERMIIYLTLM